MGPRSLLAAAAAILVTGIAALLWIRGIDREEAPRPRLLVSQGPRVLSAEAEASAPEAPSGERRPIEIEPPPPAEAAPVEAAAAVAPARVVGHVYSAHGLPVDGALLILSPARPDGIAASSAGTVEVRSGPDGAYAIEDLAAGEYWHVAYPSGDRWKDEGSRMTSIALADGETEVVDVGRPRVIGIWSGTVRNALGDAVAGRGTVRLRPPGGRGLRSFHFDEGGAFSSALEPAVYAVEIELADGRRFEVGEVVMPEVDLVEDLSLPGGTRIVGRILEPVAAGAPNLRASLRLEGHDYPSAIHGIRVNPDGTFFFDAVAPGRYRVDLWPSKIAGTAEGFLVLDVSKGVPEIALDLEVRPR